MIKNIILDFGKVLVDYDYFLVLNETFDTPEQAKDFLHQLIDGGWNERLDREEHPLEEIVSDMKHAMPHYSAQIDRFYERYTDFILGEIPGMRELLGQLKAEGYMLYGLSNWNSKVYLTMQQYPIFQLLDGRVISCEEHLTKPNPAIYECLCQRYGLKPEECVFADDLAPNVEAARAYGMHGIVFRDAVQYEKELRALL